MSQQNYTVLQIRNFLQKMCARARARMSLVLVKLMIRQEAPTGARNKTRCAETNGEDGTGDNPCNEGCCVVLFMVRLGEHMAELLFFVGSSIGTRYTLLRMYFQIYQMLSADLYFTDLQHEERLQAKNVPSTLLKNRMMDCRSSFVL